MRLCPVGAEAYTHTHIETGCAILEHHSPWEWWGARMYNRMYVRLAVPKKKKKARSAPG